MPAAVMAWIDRHQPRLLLSVRIVVATVVTFAAAHLLGFSQSYWAVLTTVIVMQSSVGGSIKATVDRLVGSLGGAIWGVGVCLWIPHHDVLTLGVALGVAVAPLALATAFNPAWRVAPVTALILLLTPTSQIAGPVAAAVQRMAEVGLGSVVAVAVALLLAPARAQANLTAAARSALDIMAQLLTVLMDGLTQTRDPHAVESLHGRIRAALAQAEIAADEARRERLVSLNTGVDPVPLCRTLRRVHHDLLMIGRATISPLPAAAGTPLATPAAEVATTVAHYLRTMAVALAQRTPPPPSLAEDTAITRVLDQVAALRAHGATVALTDDAVARLFSLTFALEQLRKDLGDLSERAAELAQRP